MTHTKFKDYYKQFQTRCNALAKAGDLASLKKLAYSKQRKAEEYSNAAAKESDDQQASYLMTVQEYCLKEADYAKECFVNIQLNLAID